MSLNEAGIRALITMVKQTKESDTPALIPVFKAMMRCDEAQARAIIEIFRRLSEDQALALVGKAGQAGIGQTRGRWEYKVFSENFPRNMKFYIDHPRAIWNRGKCPNGDLAVLIERVTQTLLQRVGAYGWEPMESVDADNLWANGRVKIEEKSDLLDWWGGSGNYTAIPIRLELNFRRWVEN